MPDQILFYLLGGLAVVASVLVIGQRNPIHSVLLLIASFAGLSGLYVLLQAPFVAVIQIIIYAGAIMVLFLFVVMLLNVGREDTDVDEQSPVFVHRVSMRVGALLAGLLVVELVWALASAGTLGGVFGPMSQAPPAVTSVRTIGHALFTDYAFAFEVTSILILVAMVGAVVLARREAK
ncbi:MAG: NADH-quinone oxidoreductase subunit J [Acidobacteriota bacterium]|nr:NADH-quinone oxidoreductase subunit J [Acidobacteriota bacterium]